MTGNLPGGKKGILGRRDKGTMFKSLLVRLCLCIMVAVVDGTRLVHQS